jgi:hypothetical protein
MSEFTNLMLSDQDDAATTKRVQIGHITPRYMSTWTIVI